MSQIVWCKNCGREINVTGLVFDALHVPGRKIALNYKPPKKQKPHGGGRVVSLDYLESRVRCCKEPELEWGMNPGLGEKDAEWHMRKLLGKPVRKWWRKRGRKKTEPSKEPARAR